MVFNGGVPGTAPLLRIAEALLAILLSKRMLGGLAMKLSLPECIQPLLKRVMLVKSNTESVTETVSSEMLKLVEQAKQEWHNTSNYFDNVTDPELIDHAILMREAAERKYMYLLKQAKLADIQAFSNEKDAIAQVVSVVDSVQANEPA